LRFKALQKGSLFKNKALSIKWHKTGSETATSRSIANPSADPAEKIENPTEANPSDHKIIPESDAQAIDDFDVCLFFLIFFSRRNRGLMQWSCQF
jgi:hypothetical protein